MRKSPYRAYLSDEEIEALYEILGDQKSTILRPFVRRLETQVERIAKDRQIAALFEERIRSQPRPDFSLLEAAVSEPTATTNDD